jgi:nucleotide-binding universal stress UspA family protein
LLEFKDEYFETFPETKTMVVSGGAAEEILKYIQTEGIDLLIMGTHGRKGLDKIIFGSVAEQVVKSSSVPVFLINPYKVS